MVWFTGMKCRKHFLFFYHSFQEKNITLEFLFFYHSLKYHWFSFFSALMNEWLNISDWVIIVKLGMSDYFSLKWLINSSKYVKFPPNDISQLISVKWLIFCKNCISVIKWVLFRSAHIMTDIIMESSYSEIITYKFQWVILKLDSWP